VTITPTLSVSADDVDYTVFAGSDEINTTGFRYVKVKYEFLAADDLSHVKVTGIQLTVDALSRFDSSVVTLAAGDAGGTVITFGSDFHKVVGIAVTPKDTAARICVVDFDFTQLNPTTFKILMFDTGDVRKSGDVAYVARGY
jgi:hypothetical protein